MALGGSVEMPKYEFVNPKTGGRVDERGNPLVDTTVGGRRGAGQLAEPPQSGGSGGGAGGTGGTGQTGGGAGGTGGSGQTGSGGVGGGTGSGPTRRIQSGGGVSEMYGDIGAIKGDAIKGLDDYQTSMVELHTNISGASAGKLAEIALKSSDITAKAATLGSLLQKTQAIADKTVQQSG